MNEENDEIISRLNRLKPVEPVLQPEPDIELLAKEEERTRLRDEYFDKKEKQERAELAKKCAIKHKSEPVQNSEPNNDEIIEEYNIPVFHHALPQYLSDDIERVQKRAFSIICP